jgi:hypothetical protein
MKHIKVKSKEKITSKIKIDISTECKICNNTYKSISGLCSHILNKHSGKTYQEYLLEYYNIDLIKINDEYLKNVELNKEQGNLNRIIGTKKYFQENKGKSKRELMGEERWLKFKESMKGVFSKEWFIKKYGDEIGIQKYEERSKNISKTTSFRNMNNNKNNWSNISQDLFWNIYKIIEHKYTKIYFGELNHEYSCGVQNHNYDFVVLDNKKIIEFNGEKFHANPDKYVESDIPIKFINKTAKEIWEFDENKNNKAINKGFQIKIVWENEYYKNKEKIILECINFIYS